jgi:glycosyltransferase involved in cell wall biosynthesis
MKKELRKADTVVCISHATRDRLLDLNLFEPAKCHVALMGVALPGEATASPPTFAATLTRPFALFVGRIEVRKNLEHVVEAVRTIEELDLVLVGEPGFGHEVIEREFLTLFPGRRMHRLSRVSEPELDWLYRHALATLQPSWEEGFGLPILEAMVRGCPVITSNCSASAEVGGSAAVLVDPEDPEQSEQALRKMLSEPGHRQKLADAGLVRCAEFSWEKYFEQLRGIYSQLLRR